MGPLGRPRSAPVSTHSLGTCGTQRQQAPTRTDWRCLMVVLPPTTPSRSVSSPLRAVQGQRGLSSRGGGAGGVSGHAAADMAAVTPQRLDWRSGLAQWREAGGSPVHRLRTGPHHAHSLTLLRSAARPSTTAARKLRSERLSMSAEPDLVHPGDGSHISAAAQRSRGEVLRVQTATSSAGLEFDRPQTRSRALPLVHNRADRAQVDAFYAELREATQAG